MENYKLINEQLMKIGKRYVPCEKEEVLEYFKNKYPIFLEDAVYIYGLCNDMKTIMRVDDGLMLSLASFDIENIRVKIGYDLVYVWSKKNNIEFNISQDEFAEKYNDGYRISHGFLSKPINENRPCTIKETIEYYKDNMIRIETTDIHGCYLLTDKKHVVNICGELFEIPLIINKIKEISIFADVWYTVWKKEN